MGIPWTKQEMDILRAMAEAGCSFVEIREVLLSRSLPAIVKKAAEERISLACRTPEVNQELFRRLMAERGVKWK